MRMRPIQVSDEYVETLCDKMLEWVQKKDSFTIPQFLQWKGIGYPYLKYIVYTYPQAQNAFEVMKAILNNRWFHLAMSNNDLPHHKSKMLMRYLRLYDSHALDVEEESKKNIVEAETKTQMQYLADYYDRSELTEPFKGIYDENIDKRRSSEET